MELSFQDSSIELNEVRAHYDSCVSIGYQPSSFGLIPFSDTITVTGYTKPTIMFGATKLVKLHLRGIQPENSVIFYDAYKFDQKNYSKILGNLLLNHAAVFFRWEFVKDVMVTSPTFIKPSSDLKYFSGRILYPSGKTIEGELHEIGYIDVDITDDTHILYNYTPLQHPIEYEYRAFVINNKVVDVCQYMHNGKVVPAVISEERKARIIHFISHAQALYEPHDHYVVDVAVDTAGNGWIVEYNCINCSGMYAIDRAKVFTEFLKL